MVLGRESGHRHSRQLLLTGQSTHRWLGLSATSRWLFWEPRFSGNDQWNHRKITCEKLTCQDSSGFLDARIGDLSLTEIQTH
jgi:hypothetical protein